MMQKIIRHSAPGKLDLAPLGTQCIVKHSDTLYDLYVQYSADEENPRWEEMGTFTQGALDDLDYDMIRQKEANDL